MSGAGEKIHDKGRQVETAWLENEAEVIDNAEKEHRNDQTLEFFHCKRPKLIGAPQVMTLI